MLFLELLLLFWSWARTQNPSCKYSLSPTFPATHLSESRKRKRNNSVNSPSSVHWRFFSVESFMELLPAVWPRLLSSTGGILCMSLHPLWDSLCKCLWLPHLLLTYTLTSGFGFTAENKSQYHACVQWSTLWLAWEKQDWEKKSTLTNNKHKTHSDL